MHIGIQSDTETRGHATIRKAALACAGILAAGGFTAAPLTASAHSSSTIFVHPGDSIQAALDKAKPGDTVKVLAGTYHQQVNVTKDDITLKGEGAADTIIEPPATSTGNCDGVGAQIGICVGVPPIAEGGPVKRVVEGVTIKTLAVTGFPGAGLFLFGTDGAKVEDVHATNDGFYGIFLNASTNGVVRHNLAAGNNEAGIYVGDSPDADAWITDNTSLDNNGSGIFFRDSKEGTIAGNKTQGNCVGILILNTGYGQGLANTSDVLVKNNDADKNNAGCPGGGGSTPLSGLGIVDAGGSKVTVTDNSAEGNNAGANPTVGSAGIVLFSTASSGGTDENNNSVTNNEIDGNATDLLWDGSGIGNTFDDNDCDTSIPSGLC
jgi:parallel beta-helix repeat protein